MPKSKQTVVSDLSPYLEPLPEPIPWTDQKNIKSHNVNIKSQMIRRKNLKNKRQIRMHNVEVNLNLHDFI